jgi:hypothetical protein
MRSQMAEHVESYQMKAKQVAAHVAAQVEVAPSVELIAQGAYSASRGGKSAAAMAETLWGAGFIAFKPDSAERKSFNAEVLKAWSADTSNIVPVAVRRMGEYRLAEHGEVVPEGKGTTLTPGFVMQYAGVKLTKLKKESPTLGALVEARKGYYQNLQYDAWRNLKEAYARLLKDRSLGKSGNARAGDAKSFGDRLPINIDKGIVSPNRASFERGDVTAFPENVMDDAVAAMIAVLRRYREDEANNVNETDDGGEA